MLATSDIRIAKLPCASLLRLAAREAGQAEPRTPSRSR
jgi:hypothetical protein